MMSGPVSIHAGAMMSRKQDFIYENDRYLMRLGAGYGYAATKVVIKKAGRLRIDNFDVGWGLTACVFFDNPFFAKGRGKRSIRALQATPHRENPTGKLQKLSRRRIQVSGHLVDKTDGTVYPDTFSKKITFEDSGYTGEIAVRLKEFRHYSDMEHIFDLNDDWCDRMLNSCGDYMAIADGVADSPGHLQHKTFRTFKQLDKGAGVWMRIEGPQAAVQVSYRGPFRGRDTGGLELFDGPDVSGTGRPPDTVHANIILRPFLPKRGGVIPNPLRWRYRVDFIHRSSVIE